MVTALTKVLAIVGLALLTLGLVLVIALDDKPPPPQHSAELYGDFREEKYEVTHTFRYVGGGMAVVGLGLAGFAVAKYAKRPKSADLPPEWRV